MLAHPAVAKVVFSPPPLVALIIGAHTPCLALRKEIPRFNSSPADLPLLCTTAALVPIYT